MSEVSFCSTSRPVYLIMSILLMNDVTSSTSSMFADASTDGREASRCITALLGRFKGWVGRYHSHSFRSGSDTVIRSLLNAWRSEERRVVGKECRSRWSPYH